MKTHEQLVDAGREIVQGAPQMYIDLDVESDGIAGYGSLLSIGAVSPWGQEFYRELRPSSSDGIIANRQFCQRHGLDYVQLHSTGEDPALVMRELADWEADLRAQYRKQGQSVLVAYNASYDFPIINLEFLRAQIDNPFGIAGYCVKSLAMAVRHDYEWQKTKKSQLDPDLVPEGDFTHNALEDARYQQQLHFALVGKLQEINWY